MKFYFIITIFIYITPSLLSSEESALFGIAEGYPPYQYLEKGKPAGVDYEIGKYLANEMGIKPEFIYGNWDSILNQLRVGGLDIVVGMEINDKRKKLFKFTKTIYHRKEAIFTLKDSGVETLEDLYLKIISGDRDSRIEIEFRNRGIRDKFRIKQTDSKEESILLLKAGKVEGVIMPMSVGIYLGNKYNLDLKTVYIEEIGTPVAIAINKNHQSIFNKISRVLDKEKSQIVIDNIIKMHEK